ncbi:MAG: beta-phosphoglucomutase [Bacteroidetes bacterium]|nr:beta-phosphoglucomutase [Bacteroidota bacterium]
MQACIFDLDGVLTDTAEQHFQSWSVIAQKFGFSLTEHHNESLKGVSRPNSLQKILDWAGASVSESEFEALLAEKNEHYLNGIRLLGTQDILPGVQIFLDDLHQHAIRCAVGSSSRNAPLILDRLELTNYFETVSDGNSVQQTKPAPDVFLHAAQELGVPPENCVVFEDAASGVEAARAANMTVVGIGDYDNLHRANFCLPNLEGFSFGELQRRLS